MFEISFKISILVVLTAFLCSCGNPHQALEPAEKTDNISLQGNITAPLSREVPKSSLVQSDPFPPFYIYTNKGADKNHYIPSGFMPDGQCLVFDDGWKERCHSDATCIRIEYDLVCSRQGQKWAGVYWLNPANNWGKRKGGFNLTGAQQLTFWARGDKGGEQIKEFIIGGINGDYPDSDLATLGPVILSKEWRQYTIDLRGKDLSYISGGFAWSTAEGVNDETCTFYLDEIRFE